MSLKSSIRKKFFEDRAGDVIRNPLVYSVANNQYIPQSDLSSFLDRGGNIRTAATQRIGETKVSSKSNENKALENVGYPDSGKSLGTVTIFQGGVPEQSLQDMVDFYRSGKNIKDVEHFGRATTTTPLIRVSPDTFFDDEADGTIDHTLNLNAYGQGFLFTSVDEKLFNQKTIPFEDISKLIASNLVGKQNTFAYPFVHTALKSLEQFVDPSSPQINGAIDVFEERRSTINSSISDLKVTGVKGDMMAGGIDDTRSGNTQVANKFELATTKTNLKSFYLDSQETHFTKFLFIQKKAGRSSLTPGTPGTTKFALPGYITSHKNKLTHFKDTVFRESSQDYKILSPDQKLSLLKNSDLSRSEIGTRFKSATNGLIFGESNLLGTDSIAFGGLKK